MKTFGGDVIGPGGAVIPITPAVAAAGVIMLSGQLAMHDGRIIGDTIEEQTAVALDNIAALLDLAGRDLSHVMKVTVWLVRAEDFAGFNRVYAERFAKPYPARSTVVSQLLIPGALVEIEAIVAAE